jgi:hypothetical protein
MAAARAHPPLRAYATDEISHEPAAFHPELAEIEFSAVELAA